MKLLVRAGAAFVAVVFASFLIFYASPLFAETNPSPQPALGEQQQDKSEQAAQQNKQREAHAEAKTERAELAGEVVATPSNTAAKAEENIIMAAAPQTYDATSYSRPGRGASGMGVRFGTIAADPRVLPYGTRVRLDAGPYSGEYVVTDAGTAIKGRKIDIWLPTFREACRFGRRNVKLIVLSYGAKRGARRAK